MIFTTDKRPHNWILIFYAKELWEGILERYIPKVTLLLPWGHAARAGELSPSLGRASLGISMSSDSCGCVLYTSVYLVYDVVTIVI